MRLGEPCIRFLTEGVDVDVNVRGSYGRYMSSIYQILFQLELLWGECQNDPKLASPGLWNRSRLIVHPSCGKHQMNRQLPYFKQKKAAIAPSLSLMDRLQNFS